MLGLPLQIPGSHKAFRAAALQALLSTASCSAVEGRKAGGVSS